MADTTYPPPLITTGTGFGHYFKGTQFISTFPPGIDLTKSFLFDGVNELFSTTAAVDAAWNGAISGVGKKFCIAFWYQRTAPAITGAIICRDTAANRQFIIQKTSTNRMQITVYTDATNSLQYISNNIVPDTGSFSLYCFVYDQTQPVLSRISMYCNNVLDVGATITQTGTFTSINANTTPFIQIGGRLSALQPINAMIHCTGLFNIAPTALQISELHNGGNSFDWRNASFGANLVSYMVAGNGTNFGAQWTWDDLVIPAATATSQNMEAGDLVSAAP